MYQKDMQQVMKGTQQCRVNLAEEARDKAQAESRFLRLERNRLQNTVDHYAEMIEGLNVKLKKSQEEVFTAKAVTAVMESMAVDSRSAKLELSYILERIDNILDETPVEDDSDASRELRLMRCTEEDREALIQAGVIHE